MGNYFDVIVQLNYDHKKKAETLIKQILNKWDKNVLTSIILFVNNSPHAQEVLLTFCFDLDHIAKDEIINWIVRRDLVLVNHISLAELIAKQKKGDYNSISGALLDGAWDQVIDSIWFR